jgi:hypothetical protein
MNSHEVSQVFSIFPNTFLVAHHFHPACFGKCCPLFTYGRVACAIGPSVKQLQNKETQHKALFCKVYIQFLKS